MQLSRSLFVAIALLATYAYGAPGEKHPALPDHWPTLCGAGRLYAEGNSRQKSGKAEPLIVDASIPAELATFDAKFFEAVKENFKTDDKLKLTLFYNADLVSPNKPLFLALRKRISEGLPRQGTTVVGRVKNAV